MIGTNSICRTCWKRQRTYPHPLELFDGKDSVCIKCLGVIRRHIRLYDNSFICHICGEGDIKQFRCFNTPCKYRYCLGCISGNYGFSNTKSILKEIKHKKWHCFVCDESRFAFLQNPDLKYRGSLGGFTPRTFVSVSSPENYLAKKGANTYNVRKKPKKGPYNVVSVVWFVKDDSFCSSHPLRLKTKNSVLKYFLGLSRNIEALLKHFKGWVLRVYYDHSVIAAYPEIAPHILKAFSKHPFIELFHFPNWPEFKNNNGLYTALIPTIFRLFALADKEIDTVIIRDIDSVISDKDFEIISNFTESPESVHRYYCENYKWPLLTGGIAFNLKKDSGGVFAQITSLIYKFLAKHYSSPEEYKPMIWERECVFRKSNKRFKGYYPEKIGVYFMDQVFLEVKLFPRIKKTDILTTEICIQGCHSQYKIKGCIRKSCEICHLTTMEYYLNPTFMPTGLLDYSRKNLSCLKNYLIKSQWAIKYLFCQRIKWSQKNYPTSRKTSRPVKNYSKPVNLLERDDISCNGANKIFREEPFYAQTEEYSTQKKPRIDYQFIKKLGALKVNGERKTKKSELGSTERTPGVTPKKTPSLKRVKDYLFTAKKRKITTRRLSSFKRIEFLSSEQPECIELLSD